MRKTVARFADPTLADELLRDLRIRSSVLCRSVMGAPWGFSVDAREVGSFHMVLEGAGWLHVDPLPGTIPLHRGDLAFLPHGNAHAVSDAEGTAAPPLTSILEHHDVVDGELRFGADDGPVTEIVCGTFVLDAAVAPSWLLRLPPVVLAGPDGRNGWRDAAARALRDEAAVPTPGARTAVDRLLESILADSLAPRLADGVDGMTTMLDPRIGRAIDRVHDAPELPWTLSEMAEAAAMSRSAFADRFRSLVGEPPIRYLTRIRLERAVRRLVATDATVAEIARSVGYGSEEAFSRAFKLRFGEAPSAFRRRERIAVRSAAGANGRRSDP